MLTRRKPRLHKFFSTYKIKYRYEHVFRFELSSVSSTQILIVVLIQNNGEYNTCHHYYQYNCYGHSFSWLKKTEIMGHLNLVNPKQGSFWMWSHLWSWPLVNKDNYCLCHRYWILPAFKSTTLYGSVITKQKFK